MQWHVTIELLAGSVTNDVLYIHHGQDAIAHGRELADQVLMLLIARLSQEPCSTTVRSSPSQSWAAAMADATESPSLVLAN